MKRRKFIITSGAVMAFPMPAVATHRVIEQNTDFRVSPNNGDFGDLSAAIGWLRGAEFRHSAKVNLRLSGAFQHDNHIFLGHPNSRYVNIYGEIVNGVPQTRLTFTHEGAQSGLVLNYGDRSGLITGLVIDLPERARHDRRGSGVLVTGGSHAALGLIDISRFYYGITSSMGATTQILHGGVVADAGDVAYFAWNGGTIGMRNCTAIRARDDVNDLGYGATAELNSAIHAFNLTTLDCRCSGQAAFSTSSFKTTDPVSKRNGHYGYEARESSTLVKIRGVTEGNGRGLYGEFSGGRISAL